MAKKILTSAGAFTLLFGLTACDDLEALPEDSSTEGDSSTQEEEISEAVALPNVVDMNLADAQDELDEMDLDLEVEEYDAVEDRGVWLASNWEVVEQDPEEGEEVEADSVVNLGVRLEDDADEESPEDDVDEEASPEPEGGSPLAESVEEAALTEVRAESFRDLATQEGWTTPIYAVTEMEDIGSSTVRVYVQESLTDSQSEDVARWFFNMTCMQVPELDTIVVQDTGGVDDNYYARQFPLPEPCRD